MGRGIPCTGHLPACGHLVFHLPVAQLHHRRLPRRAEGAAQSARLRILRVVLPPTGGRPHRACPRLHPPDTTPGRGHSRDVRTRRLLHRCRTFQESHPVRLYQRELRRAHIRQPGTVFRHRKPLWRLWLCAANLLRLLRLQRHGHRHRPPVRIPLPAQLPLALQVGLHHRVLATLAHLALHLAARLSLYLHGR